MKTIFSNKAYDVLKWLAIIFLPALAKLIASAFPRWGLPYGPEIAGTLSDLHLFLGACLCLSTVQYKIAQAQNDRDAYTEMVSQNNALRDELVMNLGNTFEQSYDPAEEKEGE